MRIDEVFDTSYSIKWKKFDDGYHAIFKNAADEKVIVAFKQVGHIHDMGWIWEVSFSVNNSNDLTQSGDQFRTLSTIIQAGKQFLRDKLGPFRTPLIMIATGERGTNRKGVYTKMMKRLLPYGHSLVTPDQFPEEFNEEWDRLKFYDEDVVISANLQAIAAGLERRRQ